MDIICNMLLVVTLIAMCFIVSILAFIGVATFVFSAKAFANKDTPEGIGCAIACFLAVFLTCDLIRLIALIVDGLGL